MRISRSTTSATAARVVVMTADPAFEDSVRATFSTSPQIGLDIVQGRLAERDGKIDVNGATVVVIDIDAADESEHGGTRTADAPDRFMAAGRRHHPEL